MESDKELYAALLEVQRELYQTEIKKDGTVSFGKTNYSYCKLQTLLQIIVPVLHTHNVYMEHFFDIYNDKETLVLLLKHTPSGQSTKSVIFYKSEQKDDKIWGGGVTYKRRYTIMAKLGIFPDDDNSELPEYLCITDNQLRELYIELHLKDRDQKFEQKLIKHYNSLKRIPKADIKKIMTRLNNMKFI